jgi:hypothetical protein
VKQRLWRAPELGFFFQDDWKLSQRLTVNLGLRWEYYGVPSDRNGRTATPQGGTAGIFGISGNDMGALFRPGITGGSLTQVELVGPNSPNPGKKLYNNDWNNWAPAVGVSWNLPWFGEGKTVLRAGYGIGYERFSLRILDVVSGDLPGLREVVNFFSSQKLDLSNTRLPLEAQSRPLAPIPFTDRSQTLRGYDTNLRTPYVQNFNIGIERQLPGRSTLSVRYVGSKGTRLLRGADMNEVNIYDTGILEAFLITQAGGNAPLLDRLLRGQRVNNVLVDGINMTGSRVFREINTTTQGHLAGNNVGDFANYINTNVYLTGARGGMPRNGGFPENWLTVNPQFLSSRLTSNFSSSTYHSLQLEWRRRFAGWTTQANYTWSRALGDEEGAGQEQVDSFRTLRNRSLDKRLMSFHRTHVFRSNTIYELPFGTGKKFLTSTNGLVSRLVGGWQFGSIYNIFSGTPLAISSGASTVNTFGDNTPLALAAVPKDLGGAQVTGNGVVYFPNLVQTPDPYIANMTTIGNLGGRSTLRAIRRDSATGQILFANAAPGVLGSVAPRFLEGPGSFRLDLNLIKNIRITERVSFQLNVMADDVLNKAQWDDPNTDINSLNFGRITGSSGNRIVILGGRINF